jgi:hypothetical protein
MLKVTNDQPTPDCSDSPTQYCVGLSEKQEQILIRIFVVDTYKKK